MVDLNPSYIFREVFTDLVLRKELRKGKGKAGKAAFPQKGKGKGFCGSRKGSRKGKAFPRLGQKGKGKGFTDLERRAP